MIFAIIRVPFECLYENNYMVTILSRFVQQQYCIEWMLTNTIHVPCKRVYLSIETLSQCVKGFIHNFILNSHSLKWNDSIHSSITICVCTRKKTKKQNKKQNKHISFLSNKMFHSAIIHIFTTTNLPSNNEFMNEGIFTLYVFYFVSFNFQQYQTVHRYAIRALC